MILNHATFLINFEVHLFLTVISYILSQQLFKWQGTDELFKLILSQNQRPTKVHIAWCKNETQKDIWISAHLQAGCLVGWSKFS